jgi:hypothetical protein
MTTIPTRRTGKYSMFSRLATGLGLMIAGLVLLSGCAARTGSQAAQAAAVETAGIAIERVHPTVNGQMLDVRYRVTDREKAKATLNRQARLYLIDQRTGTRLEVPNMAKVGKLRQLPDGMESGKIYWMFFGNPGGLVKPGSRVTMVANEARFEDILVQ